MTSDENIHQRNASNRRARAFLHDILAGGPQPYQVVHDLHMGVTKAPVCNDNLAEALLHLVLLSINATRPSNPGSGLPE